MWVLSTDRAELHYFSSPEAISDGYAAFSHVWDKTEESFQDMRRIQKECKTNNTNPRDQVCEKIRRFCELAQKHGYKWVWIDTCCIDKTSSAELSEAINSMFRYYSLACVCYGYLRDVPNYEPDYADSDEGRDGKNAVFFASRWFTRGWTLQELIAPRFFLFLSQNWEVLGSRYDFSMLLEAKFRIPAALLKFEVSHRNYSISQRMSWYGNRRTTRLEDEAYCLLGLFDIHMPTLYGEGINAFRRLQEEIMRQSPDTTLFAWDSVDNDDPHRACLFAASPSSFDSVNSRAIVHNPNPTHQARQTDDDIETDDEVESDDEIENDDEIEVVSRPCSGCSFRVLV